MSLKLYAHPFSLYCQKVLIALYENATVFEMRLLTPDDPETAAEFAALWPLKRFPLLLDGERTVLESSIIIEYLALYHPGPVRLLPAGSADDGSFLRQLHFHTATKDSFRPHGR